MPLHSSETQSGRFSPQVYAAILTLLSIGGLASSGYLALSHYRNYNDIVYESFCAISRALNCDTVSQSPYAIFLGAPVAVWGMVGYLFFIAAILFFRDQNKRWMQGWAAFTALALVFSTISILLAIVSALWIRSYCLMCIATYGINFLSLYLSWLAGRRFGKGNFIGKLKDDMTFIRQRSARALFTGVGFVVLGTAVGIFYPNYWHFPEIATDSRVEYGFTKAGSPWIGAKQPVLTITEFTDYMCFQCGKMHRHLRQLVNQYPERIRLVHRHFPLDRTVNPLLSESIHPNSGILSLFAIVGEESGKFWEVNDFLFREMREKRAVNLGRITAKLGLEISGLNATINDRKVITRLEKDIRAGLRRKISVTPSYVIGNEVYQGFIPPDVIASALEGR